MPGSYLNTSYIAREIGCHPNTVRLYETWGFLPPVPRSPAGYRRYTRLHLEQMRLARMALNTTWPGRRIRESAVRLVRFSATGDLGGALEMAYQHLSLVRAELAQAESAALLLERWAQGAPTDATSQPLQIGEAARLLGLTVDMLRDWERNGLLRVPRHPHNRYRQYGQVEIARLRVIRMLRMAGYSTMAILRMLLQLDRGDPGDVRQLLDTPRDDEDVYYAADRWLSTLAGQEQRALELIAQLEKMIQAFS
jgi:DNA-binding transcriptional MerR regulator